MIKLFAIKIGLTELKFEGRKDDRNTRLSDKEEDEISKSLRKKFEDVVKMAFRWQQFLEQTFLDKMVGHFDAIKGGPIPNKKSDTHPIKITS
jgi:hypothetical protein